MTRVTDFNNTWCEATEKNFNKLKEMGFYFLNTMEYYKDEKVRISLKNDMLDFFDIGGRYDNDLKGKQIKLIGNDFYYVDEEKEEDSFNKFGFETKVCIECGKNLDISEFGKSRKAKDKLQSRCKKYSLIMNKKWRKTKKGVVSDIYNNQKYTSKRRGYILPNYSLSELREWAFRQEIFHNLFLIWEKSNYIQDLKPSFDRKNDYLPYTLDNLQIMTWYDNNKKGNDDIKNGINNKNSKAVVCFNKTLDMEKIFYSISEASRQVGLSISHISNCVNGKINRDSRGNNWRPLTKAEVLKLVIKEN